MPWPLLFEVTVCIALNMVIPATCLCMPSLQFRTAIHGLAPTAALHGKWTRSGKHLSQDHAEQCFLRWSFALPWLWLVCGAGTPGPALFCWHLQLCSALLRCLVYCEKIWFSPLMFVLIHQLFLWKSETQKRRDLRAGSMVVWMTPA